LRGFLDVLARKIFLLVSRGRLIDINNDNEECQKIQIASLANETITDITRYQEYGFENYPILTNAETINLFVNGNRDASRGINICINNRKLRPTDLKTGDVCMYSKDSNDTNKNRVWIKPDKNEIEISTYDDNKVLINEDGITIDDTNGHNITLDNSGIILTDGVNTGNEITADSNGVKITDANSNTIEMKSTGVFFTDSAGNTIALDNNLISLKNSVSDMKTELENIWKLIASLNTNLASFTSINCVVGSPVTPNPATLALFAADLVQANLYKAALSSFLK
jgi:phage gp45-like